jgi:hypothetical protein
MLGLGFGFTSPAVLGGVATGGAPMLGGETNGVAADFTHAVDAQRVAVKTAGVITEYAPDGFISNAGTSPKQTYDATGALVWSPHNMYIQSAVPATRSVTTVVGQNYTITVTGSGSLTGSAGASGVATAGAPLTYTATTTTSTFTLAGSLTTVQMNRGAVATAYLATTASARYGLAVDSQGLLVEPAATNLLLNSTTLSTQSVTVTAVAHTLSFWGTGTITLSGTSTAGPLVGTGAGNRVSLTFTPTAGSLTCTVSGTVSNAQLETGAVATSPIPTYSLTGARVADNYSFLLSTIPALAAEYSLYLRCSTPTPAAGRYPYVLTDGSINDNVGFTTAPTITLAMRDNNVALAGPASGTALTNVVFASAGRIKVDDVAISTNGAAAAVDNTAPTLPTMTQVSFACGSAGGASTSATFRIARMAIVTDRGWSNAELLTKSAA